MLLEDLNRLDAAAAAGEFLRCCGSRRWAALMAGAGPFSSVEQVGETADAIWSRLEPADWLEAFAAHPRIGGAGEGWSAQEQRGAANASSDIRARLALRNRDYEARFGYIFIVCATGKSAADMLRLLEARLSNDPGEELRVAAGEQRQITRLRLARLLDA